MRGDVLVLQGGSCRRLNIALRYCEATLRYSAVAFSLPTVVLHEGTPGEGERFAFERALPPDALPN